jgi:hypothetical protein
MRHLRGYPKNRRNGADRRTTGVHTHERHNSACTRPAGCSVEPNWDCANPPGLIARIVVADVHRDKAITIRSVRSGSVNRRTPPGHWVDLGQPDDRQPDSRRAGAIAGGTSAEDMTFP